MTNIFRACVGLEPEVSFNHLCPLTLDLANFEQSDMTLEHKLF